MRHYSQLFTTIALAAATVSADPATIPANDTPDQRPTVGAIRWDAWFGDRGPAGKAVEASLGPAKWHDRLPFFAEVLSDGAVRLDGSSQTTIDREIGYAAGGGLDYWAFVLYPAGDPLSLGIERYLSSRRRAELRFCIVTECARWRDPAFVQRAVELVRERGYQTVHGGRPLVYLGFISDEATRGFSGGLDGFRQVLDTFREKLTAAGSPRPYIVVMDPTPRQGKTLADTLECDAISSYAVGWETGTIDYERFVGNVERHWEQSRLTGARVVPIVMTGWDRRPRVERPVPWETWQQPGQGLESYVRRGTPEAIARHAGRAVDWIEAHPEATPARTSIVYAWNEFDEGGWLAPTRSEGTARLDAMGTALRGRKTASRPGEASRPARTDGP